MRSIVSLLVAFLSLFILSACQNEGEKYWQKELAEKIRALSTKGVVSAVENYPLDWIGYCRPVKNDSSGERGEELCIGCGTTEAIFGFHMTLIEDPKDEGRNRVVVSGHLLWPEKQHDVVVSFNRHGVFEELDRWGDGPARQVLKCERGKCRGEAPYLDDKQWGPSSWTKKWFSWTKKWFSWDGTPADMERLRSLYDRITTAFRKKLPAAKSRMPNWIQKRGGYTCYNVAGGFIPVKPPPGAPDAPPQSER